MSSQSSVSYQWMRNFQIVQMGWLEEYFRYWHGISVIPLHMRFLFMYFSKHFFFPFEVGIVLASLKVSEIDSVSRGALSFALHAVIVMRAVVKCQCSSCGWLFGDTDRHVPFPYTVRQCKCTAPAEKMDRELILWSEISQALPDDWQVRTTLLVLLLISYPCNYS